MILRLILMFLLLSQASNNYSLVHAPALYVGRASRLTRSNPIVTCFDPVGECSEVDTVM